MFNFERAESFIGGCVVPSAKGVMSVQQYQDLLEVSRGLLSELREGIVNVINLTMTVGSMTSQLAAYKELEEGLVTRLQLQQKSGNLRTLIWEGVDLLLAMVNENVSPPEAGSDGEPEESLDEFFDSDQEEVDDECE